ncbi:unnamed protein product [Rhizoctonia solani]|uniref:NADH-cytochrome b5 reductase 1 n=1 Tax=Rhizoctonia solani TaxID=456999 RepID=A0A8H2XFF3_9AGAM|nr:unnamed protein product [Rhizoctonia solani]
MYEIPDYGLCTRDRHAQALHVRRDITSHVKIVSAWATMLLDFTEVFKQTGQLAQFSPGTTYLLTAVRDQLVVRRCGTFQIARTWDVDTSPSSTNSLVAPTNTRSGTSRVLRSSSTTQKEEATPDGWITHIGWSCDSEYVLACCSKRGVVNVYSMVDPQWNARVEAGAEGLARAEWAPDGRSVICFSEWGLRVTVWSLLDGTATYIQFPKHMDRGYTFRKDGRYFILAERHKSRDTIGVYDARDGYKVTRHFQSPTQSLAAMSLSPNGRHLAVWEGPLEYKLSILNLAGTVLRTFTPDPDPGLGIRSVAWHPSGAFLAVGGWDDKVHILSSLSWSVVITFELSSRVPLGVKVWKEPANWLTKGSEGSFSEYDRGVGITALTITRRDGAKGLPKAGAAQIEWNLTGTMFFVRYESTSTALHIYNFPAPDEPFKPSLKTVLLHATPITRASWNPVRAESLAISCSRSAVYMWTSNNEWVNDNVGEIEDEGAECIGVPGRAAATCAALYFLGSKKRAPILDPKEWKDFPLIEKIEVSPNTAIYRFGLPDPNDILGLPIGQHISVQAEINGKDIMRSYTPTSSDDDRGHFDLLVKAYEKGNISRYLSLLKIGDKVRIKGPKGQFNYHPSLSRELGMIAGGTGITPMLQIIRAALKNPLDLTKINLIYANVSKEDILLKAELDDLAARYPSRFSVYYVLNNPPEGWDGGIGFVTKDMIEKHMPPTDSNIKILLCGPPPMINAMKKHLDDLGYPAPRTVSKLVDQVFLF